MMRLGFASAILPDLALEDVLEFAAETGYACVEVMCWPKSKAERRYAGITHIDVNDDSPATFDKVQSNVAKSNVAISALGYYPNCLSADATESHLAIEHLKKVIISAPRLGLKNVNTFIGRNPKASVDDNWPRLLEVWKPIVALAEEQGVKIGIENCPMFFTKDEWPGGKNIATSPAIWKRLFADIGSPNLGLNFDPSHFVWQRMDYIKVIYDFSDRLFHLHAKDARIDQAKLDLVGLLANPNEYHSPKLPGLGEVNWSNFFSALGDIRYQGDVCVEVEDRSYEGEIEMRKESLRQSYRYLKQFMPIQCSKE